MTIEEAIKTAIEYEQKVCGVYAEACDTATSEVGKRVFRILSEEEQGHVDYLNHKLEELQKTGTVTPESLDTAIPAAEAIGDGIDTLENKMAADDRGIELQMLKKALDVEIETGDFYRRMVDELGSEGQQFFARFVEIENGHQAIVQAEIDSVSGSGFWFDIPEFNLEG